MPAMLCSFHFWQQGKHWKNILMRKITGKAEKETVIQTLRQNTKDLLTAETLTFNRPNVELKLQPSEPSRLTTVNF